MSYKIQANLADDGYLRRRVTACAAAEKISDPDSWASLNRWALSTSNGWVETYGAAVRDGIPNPGEDEAVISDAMILDAVQALNAGGTNDA